MNLKYERISQWWSTRDVQKRLSHRLSRSHTTQLSNNINPAGAGFIMHRTQTHAYYAAADNTTMYRQTDLLPPQPPPLEHISMRPKSAQFGQHAVRNTNTSLNTVGIIVWTILLFFFSLSAITTTAPDTNLSQTQATRRGLLCNCVSMRERVCIFLLIFNHFLIIINLLVSTAAWWH
jgi:hypothetical protein